MRLTSVATSTSSSPKGADLPGDHRSGCAGIRLSPFRKGWLFLESGRRGPPLDGLGIIPLTETCSFQPRLTSRVGEVGNPNAVQMRQSRTPRHVIPPTRRSFTGPLAQILMKIGGKPALPDGPEHGTFRSFSQRYNPRWIPPLPKSSKARPLRPMAPLPSFRGSRARAADRGRLNKIRLTSPDSSGLRPPPSR